MPHPLGAEDLHSLDEVAAAIADMLDDPPVDRPGDRQAQRGRLGHGQRAGRPRRESRRCRRRSAAARSLERVQPDAARVARRPVRRLRRQARDRTAASSRSASWARSCSAPACSCGRCPDGRVELLSTHDQLLGGASGQSYLGCTFPADPAYSRLISEPAMAIGERLAREGVLGRFAVDFVVVRDAAGDWSAYAIELNLRKGGTTHPFLTLQFLTDGSYDAATGRFLTRDGAGEAPRRHRPPRVRRPARPVGRRPVRRGRPARPALRPVPAGGHRVPHDQLAHRAWGGSA